MPVTVNQELLPAEEMGLSTVGQVLSHLRQGKRLITSLLIDGREPDLDRLGVVRRSPLRGHTVYIETSEPRQIVIDALGEIEQQLAQGDRLRNDAVDLLRDQQPSRAMEQLSGCFSSWRLAQESVLKIAQLMRLDLEKVRVPDSSLADLLSRFTGQLRDLRCALEVRDFPAVCAILTCEAAQASIQWRAALAAIRDVIRSN